MESEPMGIGVIGTGGIAEAHLVAYQRAAGKARLVAVADIDRGRAESAAERYGADHALRDYRELLARDDLDAVSICTPPFTHVEIAVAALEAGKHVLCEKPVAGTLADLDRIEEAERRSGRLFSGVFQLRFGRGAQQVRTLLDEGKFGALHLGMAETLWFRDDAYYGDVAWRGTWPTECGGVTVSQAVHLIDALLWFMGDAEHVYANAGSFRDGIDVEDTSVAVVGFKSGALGQITNTVSAQSEQRSLIELHGTKLSAISQGPVYDATVEPFQLASADASYAAGLEAEMEERYPKGWRLLHRGAVDDFLGAIASGRSPLAGVDACRRALEVTTAIYKSAMTGERVSLPIARDDPFYSALPPAGFALPGA